MVESTAQEAQVLSMTCVDKVLIFIWSIAVRNTSSDAGGSQIQKGMHVTSQKQCFLLGC